MPPSKERRPAGDRTALGNFDNITEHGFNPDLDHKQEAADAQLFEQLADLRFRRAVEQLHRLGPRPLHEMLVELGTSRLIRTEIERQVERYAALDPHILCQLGGDRFPPPPLHCAGGRR
jgi:hypothetical protein